MTTEQFRKHRLRLARHRSPSALEEDMKTLAESGERGLTEIVMATRRFERLLVLPFRMQGCHCLHAIKRKGQLDIHWMLRPQGPIIVEYRDALVRRTEIRPTLPRDPGDELDDRTLLR
jgi:hypothetical protein